MRKHSYVLSILTAVCAFSLLLPPTVPSQMRQVKLQLDWVVSGYHTGFFVALDKGFYKAKGLDVSISRGFGSGDTAKVVAAGAADIGLMGVPTQIISRGRGAPVVTIASIVAKAPESFLSFEEKGIKTLKDVEGKSFAESAGSAMLVEWPAFTNFAGLDKDKITHVPIEAAAKAATFFSGQVDFVAGWRPGFDEPVIIRARKEGKKLRFIRWEDHGWKVYGSGLGTSEALLARDPKLVEDFVSATMDGFAYMISHPDESLDITLKNNPEMEREITRLSMLFGIDAMTGEASKENGLGYLEPDRMQFMIDLMAKLLNFDPPKAEQMYTNRFITKKPFTVSAALQKELAELP